MACKYKSKLCFSGWCDVACMYCTFTQERNCEHNKKTNADRIREMSNEELAKFLDTCESMGYEDSSIATDSGGHCMDMLEWLKQQAE